jgi:hypothetical protein
LHISNDLRRENFRFSTRLYKKALLNTAPSKDGQRAAGINFSYYYAQPAMPNFCGLIVIKTVNLIHKIKTTIPFSWADSCLLKSYFGMKRVGCFHD